MKDFFAPMIIAFVLSVLFSISSRYKAEKDEKGDYILQYAIPIKIFGAVFLALGVVVSSLFFHKFANKGTENLAPLLLCVVFFIVLLLCLFIEFFYVRYSVNSNFICSHTPWSQKRSIYWKDVRSIYYSQSLRWFVIKDNISQPIRVGAMVSGVDIFLEIIKTNTAEDVWQKLQKNLE